ncbi:DUF1294 domain-containing protein [Undibacterium rugosum]|uniref:DUF1294 domain-containing protein n=1 Tax=Undibacterium rugosum TaxID=2762291 RepID=A0A923I129_9BURK|nr:DUF1294 domain-containing protein [Undibacterium rugosum]MBC3934527.1 DUF1294 domain-containing protein [Undibacterium rugosum]MBR7777142.1 DUF1294 domain-containing protein [Undibacterium rugosum]
MVYLLLACLVWNLLCFGMMGMDKYLALRGKQRISELTLLLSALFAGSAGIWLGMLVWRHKSAKRNFQIRLLLVTLVQLLLLILLRSDRLI